MKKIFLIILTVMLIFSLTCPVMAQTDLQPVPEATAQEGPSIGMKILDVFLVRPFCMIGSTISTVVYVAVSPLAFVMGLGESGFETMVQTPWEFTSCRYVGEFNHYKERCSLDE